MSILAVIPARGGSKGLAGKNIQPLGGKPLIAWTIASAKAVRPALDRILVSTDDDAIAETALTAGAEVPFRRPAELAQDTTPTLPVIQHAVAQAESESGQSFEWILLLQPTSPLRTEEDIENAIGIARAAGNSCDSVVSVVARPGEHPRLAKCIEDGRLRAFDGGSLEGARRQDCEPPIYFNNGAIYLTRRNVIMEEGLILGVASLPYVMPRERSIDIDDLFDFKIAEMQLQN